MLTLYISFHLSLKKRLQTKALHAKSIVIPFDYKALKRVLGDRVPDLFHALDLAPDEAFQALALSLIHI